MQTMVKHWDIPILPEKQSMSCYQHSLVAGTQLLHFTRCMCLPVDDQLTGAEPSSTPSDPRITPVGGEHVHKDL